MNKEFLAKKKEINELKTNKADKTDLSILEDNIDALETDVNTLKAVDTSLGTRIDNVDNKASTAKTKAEEGVAKADNALTAAGTNATNIVNLQNDVTELQADVNTNTNAIADLKKQDQTFISEIQGNTAAIEILNKDVGDSVADIYSEITSVRNTISPLESNVNILIDEKNIMGSRLTKVETTLSNVKTTAETAETKADNALARNIFTDEEKAKLASITNPIIIKGRVDTVNDLPTEAEIGWFYFVGLESASSYEEYCYSENGWEYIGLSQEGVDLSNYYTKKQVDTTINELKAIDNSLGTRIDNVDSKASAAKIKAEEGVAKADNALTKASSNTTNINSLQTDVNSLRTDVNALKTVDESIWTNLDTINKTASAAKLKAEEGVAKADNALTATRTNADNINAHETRLDSIDNTLSGHDTRITTAQQKANSVDEKVNATNEVVGQLSTSLQSAYNKINAHTNDIAINRTTLGTQCKNLLNETEYLSSIKTATNGTLSKSDNSITLTATSNDCYTAPFFVGDNGYRIPVSPNTTYILSWESDNSNYGIIYVFMNGIVSKQQAANNSVTKYLKFTTDIDATFITIRFSVKNSGDSITYSNIMLRYADISDDTYEPYKESVDERLIQNKSDIAVNKTTLGYQCKNLFDWKNAVAVKSGGVTFNKTDNDISVTSSGAWASVAYKLPNLEIGVKYTFSATVSNLSKVASTVKMRLSYGSGGGSLITDMDLTDNGEYKASFIPTMSTVYVLFYPNFSADVYTNSFTASDIMLRYADILDDTYEPYQPSVQEQTPYSLSVSGKSTSAAISYSGVPTLICLTPNTADSTTGGLYMINSTGAVIKLIEKTGVVIAADATSKTFTITNNTSTVMDVCISRCWGR